MSTSLIFLVVAIVCFVLAAINIAVGDIQLVTVGLAFFAASFLPSRSL